MPREPLLGRRSIAGDIDQFGIVTGSVEDKDRAGRGPLGHRELQLAIDGEGLVDAQDDGALAAIITLVQGNRGKKRRVADTSLGVLAYQPTAAVAVFPGSELLAMPPQCRMVGRAIRKAETGKRRNDNRSRICASIAGSLSPCHMPSKRQRTSGSAG